MDHLKKLYIANLFVTNADKTEILGEIASRIKSNQKTWVITLYSEFLYHALKDNETKDLLSKADIALADGIGMFLAKRYLELPLRGKGYWAKHMYSSLQMLECLIQTLVSSKKIKQALPEKISGSDFIWDLAELAAREEFKIFLAGGFGDTTKKAAEMLEQKYPGIIAGYSNKDPDNKSLLSDIEACKPDMVLVAYGPLRQEVWIFTHKEKLSSNLFIGLGGTFDYLAGTKKNPPNFMRKNGLEWLWRLATQPARLGRIINATVGLCYWLIRYKVNTSLPYRNNVACVIINGEGKIFLGKRLPDKMARNKNHWMFPQGGLEPNEDTAAAGVREIGEETGITSLSFIELSENTYQYDWPLGFSKKFRGQSQKIAYFKFYGTDNEINLTNHPITEFEDYKWVKPELLTTSVHALRKELAEIVVNDLIEMRGKGII